MLSEWNKITEESYICGFRRVKRRYFQLEDKRIDKFDIIEEKPIVVILAITKNQEILTLRQFRPGPEKILLDLPGGYLGDQESVEEGAARQLLNDTGYTGQVQKVNSAFENPYSSRLRYNFVATECELTDSILAKTNAQRELNLMTLTEFWEFLKTGQSDDLISAYAGLQHLGLINL